MKTVVSLKMFQRAGSALVLTLIMTAIALAILASTMSWSSNSTRQTYRSIQYTKTVAAADGATEKVIGRMTRDFLYGGQKIVTDNLDTYRQLVPTASDSATWGGWVFNDATNTARTYVQAAATTNFVVKDSVYAGLRGNGITYTVVSHAQERAALQNVTGGVLREVRLTGIPIFQFAMYSSGDMEISCGQPLRITGRVHANKMLYVEPSSTLTFQSDVTAVSDIVYDRHPLDTRPAPTGPVVYQGDKDAPVPAMTLPIGTTNTPEAIRQIIQPPPPGESPTLPISQLRYYNQVDMVITIDNSGFSATSGKFDNFTTPVPSNQLVKFITLTNSFTDWREEKTVRPIDIDVDFLRAWAGTNVVLKPLLGRDLYSLYVRDRRTLPGTQLGAVRLVNGRYLPTNGLTVATDRPLYVWGHYNQMVDANLATTNTLTTRPASLVADAVTLLSTNWLDSRSGNSDINQRPARPTTVNAAILTGVVETTLGKYSGGMENFPRFLEAWGLGNPLTYNGSMVKMFPSLYATNAWGKDHVYDPPRRNWAYDLCFNDPTRLPPSTPSLLWVNRGRWTTVAPGVNTAAALP